MQSSALRTVIPVFCLALLWGMPLQARPRYKADGQKLTVETDRYRVDVDGLAVTRIENRLTGETYAGLPDGAAPANAALKQMLAERGVSVESLRPAVPVKRFGIGLQTRVTSRAGFRGASVTYTGLQYGEGETAEFEERMTLTLTLRVDPRTGDLVITPTVTGNIAQVHGVRDRGVLRNSLHVLNLADRLRVILPAMDGVAYTAADAPADWLKSPARFRWPMVWEAALFIAEDQRGCLGIWADEAPLNYGRHLSLCRSGDGWHAGFEFETTDLIYQCDEIKNASWRLNVFPGYWVNAARRYQQQMMAQWGMRPLAERAPAWADQVRVAIGSYMSAVGADQLPRDTAITFTSQGWLKGWNDGQIHRKGGGDYFPNWPLDNPTHYEAADGWAEQATAIEAQGVHVFPYVNTTIIDSTHPWIAKKIHDRHFHSWRIWQRFFPEQCLDIVRQYGVSGIYEDCSWVMSRHENNGPDGENWYNGSVRMREYFNRLMPQIGLCGERNNEVTARGQHFALTITQSPGNAHPVGSFLFEPFIRIWNLQPSPAGMDPDDIRGFITTWPSWGLTPLQEGGMVLKRGQIAAREQLRSYWPETWDAAVMHYFKGQDGAEYRFVRDRGTRFVKVLPDGTLETIYWRAKGVPDVAAPGAGIAGWPAYDGERIIGLNTNVPLYVIVQDAERPPVTISAAPEGFAVCRSVLRDGYWLAGFAAADTLKAAPAPDAPAEAGAVAVRTLRVRSDRPVRFLGAESVKALSENEYELQVALPGAVGAFWGEPTAVTTGQVVSTLPALYSGHDRLSGLVYHEAQMRPGDLLQPPVGDVPAQEGTVAWLLRLPQQPLRLAFSYGTTHGYGDGANYMVRVNGRELWKAYRRQQSEDPEEAKAHAAPPIPSATVDLAAYAGQTVILELAANGHQSGGSETIAWGRPLLEPSAGRAD